MTESLDPRVEAMLTGVRTVPPTEADAQRLWHDYQHSYRGDEDLLVRVCEPGQGIDGLTESMTADDILGSMQMRDTVTLEVASGGGFVIVRYATRDDDSKQSFHDYYLGEVFDHNLQFRNDEDRQAFMRRLEAGNVMYFAEFVSRRGRAASAALILAAYQEVCAGRFAAATGTIVGKCLDSAQIGQCKNTIGNRPVKTLVESLALEKIAVCDQLRPLHDVAGREDLLKRAFPDAKPQDITATLSFALYCGDVRTAFDATLRQLKSAGDARCD